MPRPSARSRLRGTSASSGASRQRTGSNSRRSARSARSSSSSAAAAGFLPERGRTRPRGLITSARVQVLFSCWASATAFCAARASSSSAAGSLLELRGAGAQVGGDGLAAGGEQAHHLARDAGDLEAVAVVAGGPFQAEPAGEGFFQVLGDDRGDGADVLVVAQGVRGAPFAVGGCFGGVGDLGVDVQLHVAVARGVLEPVRYGQVGFVPLAGFAAVDAGVVVGAGAGVAGFALEVGEAGPD